MAAESRAAAPVMVLWGLHSPPLCCLLPNAKILFLDVQAKELVHAAPWVPAHAVLMCSLYATAWMC